MPYAKPHGKGRQAKVGFMINFLRRWFGGGAATPAMPLPVARGEEAAQWPEGTTPPWQASDLDLVFNRLALGVAPAEEDTLTANEQAALRHLRDQLNGDRFDPKSLPRLPALVPQLLRSLRSDDVGSAALAAQIGKDPVLVGEIVRVCNSAMFRGSGTIDSLQQGVMLLGQDGLRRVVMQLVMRPILQRNSRAPPPRTSPAPRRDRRTGVLVTRRALRTGHAAAWPGRRGFVRGLSCRYRLQYRRGSGGAHARPAPLP